MITPRTSLTRLAATLTAVALTLTACGSTDGSQDQDEHDHEHSDTSAPEATENDSATPRLALSYDGGILILDAEALEQVGDLSTDGFIRLNAADNGRHVFVSEADGFRILDMGTWTRQHGDHGHYYTAQPRLTDLRFGGAEPGHVVPHDDRITLFSDGTGEVNIVEPAELLRGNARSTSYTVPQPHHGVAVARGDGSLVVTVGDEVSRSGVAILDSERNEIARNDDCPGVHGEAAAEGGALTFGCQDGILVVRGNDIQKVDSPDAYGRIGNQAGSDQSPYVLGDYKTDEDADLERPTRFTLTDTRDGALRIIDIEASYSFRSLKRGPNGEVVILGTDGALHIFDPETGEETNRIPVIDGWTEPDEWQSPMPNVAVLDGVAYVSDPQSRSLTAIDLASGDTVAEATLAEEVVELTGVTG